MSTPYEACQYTAEHYRMGSKVLGWRARNGVYFKYDEASDCFVFSIVNKTYLAVDEVRKDHTGKDVVYRVSKIDKKENWEQNPYAYVFKDRLELIRGDYNPILKPFGATVFKPRSIKTLGRRWVFPNAEATGSLPLTYWYSPPRIEFKTAPKVRKFDKAKQKELNDLLRRLKRMVIVRSKLGAFANVQMSEINEALDAAIGIKTYSFLVDREAEQLKRLLDQVRDDDIKTFYPVMALADRYCSWAYKHYQELNGPNWEVRFDNLINRMRESLRRTSGAVDYVEADESRPDRQDDDVEAHRSDELCKV